MPFFAQYDSTQPLPQQVIGWYDTTSLRYPNLPSSGNLVLLTSAQWAEHIANPSGWQINADGTLGVYTPPPPTSPPPPTLQQQAAALLRGPVVITSTSVPALDGSYPIDQVTQGQITGIASAINAGLGLPGEGDTFNWPDTSGTPHPWPATQFTAFAKAVMNFVYAAAQVAQGNGDTLPSNTLTIP